MVKDQVVQKFLSDLQAYKDSQLDPEAAVSSISGFIPNLVTLLPHQKTAILQALEHRGFLSPLYTKHFTVLYSLFTMVFQLPPLAAEEPPLLLDLFKGSSARYQLLELQNLAGQLPVEQQLYTGLKIAETIEQIKAEKDDKLHCFTDWYLILLQIGQRAVKSAVQRASRGESYQHLVKGTAATISKALTAAKVDSKIQGIHQPGSLVQPSPELLLRHYSLLMVLDVTEGLINLQQHSEVKQYTYAPLKSFLNKYFDEVCPSQLVFQCFAVQKHDGKSGFKPTVCYNPAGVCFFLDRWLSQPQVQLAFSPMYKLKLALPCLLQSLQQRKLVPAVHKSLIQKVSSLLLQIKSPINNLNQFLTRLDVFLQRVYDFIGGIHEQAFQDSFIAAFNHVCKLCDQTTLYLLFKGLFQQSSNSSFLAHLLGKLKTTLEARLQKNAGQCELVSIKGLGPILLTFLKKNDTLAFADRAEEFSKLAQLLAFLKQKARIEAGPDHVLGGPVLAKEVLQAQVKGFQKSLQQMKFKLGVLKSKGKQRNQQEQNRLQAKIDRTARLKDQLLTLAQ